MPASTRLQGLVAATHTPFHADGSLNLAVVEKQATQLIADGVSHAFIGGTTGESASLTVDERLQLAVRWMEVTRESSLKVVVHVGANCLSDAAVLATQAGRLGAAAVSALAPSYFKPRDAAALVASMAQIAAAAPDLPFYYYEIPTMTGVSVAPSQFLEAAADRIPNLAGLKFTSSNLMEYQLCCAYADGAFDVPFGFDEMLLAALAFGARGAVGSTYNFAAPVYLRLMAAFERRDFEAARKEQLRTVRFIQRLASAGYMAAAKAVMSMRGIDVGPPRLPNSALSPEATAVLRADLEAMGFFEWIKP